jgi:mannosyltransferase
VSAGPDPTAVVQPDQPDQPDRPERSERSDGAHGRTDGADGRIGGRAERLLPVLVPAACMFVLAMWNLARPSYWRDEAATLSAVRRSLPDLWHMLGHTDVVHGAYYLLLWPIVHGVGSGELATRLPSAAAAAAAAGGVAAIGRRVADAQVGLAAGLIFAVLPVTSEFAQQARSYAIVMALAVAASYLLVRALDSAGRTWPWWAGYGLALAAMGWLHIMSLTIIPAHVVTLMLRRPGLGRATMVGWFAAVGGGLIAVSPLAVLAWQQRDGTQRFLHTTSFLTVGGFPARLTGSWLAVAAIAPLAVIGFRTAGPGSRLVRLGLPWLLLPGGLMIAVGI